MLQCVRATDSVVRLGGDEFVVLLTDQTHDAETTVAALHGIRTAVAQSIEIEGRHLQVTCSMGVSVYPQDGRDVETLIKNADAAMYSAKGSGKDRFRFYTHEMNAQVLDRLFIQEQLRDAIKRSELYLVYQPQVDLRTGQIFAVEALLRWTHPDLGDIPPSRFIPVAEESGLIVAIGHWALRAACRQNKAWQEAGLPPIVVSVNVSARQFREKAWTGEVRDMLAETGLEARYLELEVTESMLMHDLSGAIATMRDLKACGIQLSIDDFGTGYSSLSALKTFPVSRLKIDQSFVRDLAEDDNDKAIAAAVISMGQKLGLRVIAEGVETQDQLAFLKQNNCDEMQGYLFSRPVPADAIGALLTRPCSEACGARPSP